MSFDAVREFVGNTIGTIFGSRSGKILKQLAPRVEKINALEASYCKLTDKELAQKTKDFRAAIAEIRKNDPKADENGRVERYLDEILHEAFAVVREAGKRTLGMRHFDVQLIGGMVLHKGMIAEMVTGEGKTLVATLPCYLNALPRRPHEYAYVHLVTVNDYLARRDCEWNQPIFHLLGLTSGAIQSNMSSGERHSIYSKDIVYGTSSEFGFDYLRDNMKLEPELQVQQKRHFSIIDEVDSILIDEARTPLIISGGPNSEITEKYEQAAKLAQHLKRVPQEEQDRIIEQRLQGEYAEPEVGHYIVEEKDHTVALTQKGIEECERYLGIDNFYAGAHMDWPHFIDNALKAKELYKKEVKYLVTPGRDGKLEVIIMDENTGRAMHGRRWSDGLHQAVEAKEKLSGEPIEMEAETQTLATITVQNFFKLYNKLAGMTGTAITESKEFGQIYKLEVVSAPTNRPMRRANHPDVIFGTEKEKWDAIVEEIEKYHACGRPILIGTTSVEKSERLAGLLERQGFRNKFSVLNAKPEYAAREASTVAGAGNLGAITVATNMAGRGTDIKLGRFTIDEQIEHWQELELAPKSFDTSRSKEEMEEHLYGYWAKHFLDDATFKNTPKEMRREVLEAFWRERMMPTLKLAADVRELGGLHIIGTERHESRRIDNQLRGRSGRQGDPGSSRFFLSLDDDLMRIFARDWVRDFLRRSGMKDGAAIESKMVSRSIEKAQRRVEEQNFGIRKRLLEYDEVMNEQRKLIYGLRQNVLEWKELRETMYDWMADVTGATIDRETAGEGSPEKEGLINLAKWAMDAYGIEVKVEDLEHMGVEEIESALMEKVKAKYDEEEKAWGKESIHRAMLLSYSADELSLPDEQRIEMVVQRIAETAQIPLTRIQGAEIDTEGEIVVRKDPNDPVYFNPEEIKRGALPTIVYGVTEIDALRKKEHDLLLNLLDHKWKDHLQNMDVLREGIHLRGYAQKDPKLEYKREGFDQFYEMFTGMKEQAAGMFFKVPREAIFGHKVESVWNEDDAVATHSDAKSVYEGGDDPMGGASAEMEAQSEHGGTKIQAVQTIRRGAQVRPNDPCPCGSGKKFKKCHGRYGAEYDPTLPAPGKDRQENKEAKIGG